MLKTRKTLIGGAAGLLTAASIAMAGPAFAADIVGSNQPNVVTAAQGSTTTLNWTIRNDDVRKSIVDGGTLTFNAPAGTTFPAQSTVPSTRSVDGGATYIATTIVLDNCSVGNGGATLTCAIDADNGAPGTDWQSNWLRRFSPTVAVSPTATPGTYSAAATGNFVIGDMNAAGTANSNVGPTSINYGTLDIQIVPQADAPMVDPLVGGGAAALALGAAAGIWAVRKRGNPAATTGTTA